jgi:hypothetical protein
MYRKTLLRNVSLATELPQLQRWYEPQRGVLYGGAGTQTPCCGSRTPLRDYFWLLLARMRTTSLATTRGSFRTRWSVQFNKITVRSIRRRQTGVHVPSFAEFIYLSVGRPGWTGVVKVGVGRDLHTSDSRSIHCTSQMVDLRGGLPSPLYGYIASATRKLHFSTEQLPY